MKILIADDDSTSRKIISKALADRGECDSACDGNEVWSAFARARAEGAPYDLIVLDILMPGMDGLEVLGKIRAAESASGVLGTDRVKITMATCLEDKDHVIKAFRDQCDGYITKPYGPETILRDLRRDGLI